MPARIRRQQQRRARLTSRVQMPAARPYGVSLAMAIASASSSNSMPSGPARRSPRARPARRCRRHRGWSAGRSSRRSPHGPAGHRRRRPPPAPDVDVAEDLGQLPLVDDRAEAASAGRAARPGPAPDRSPRHAPPAPAYRPMDDDATRRCRSGRCCRRSPSRWPRPRPRGRRGRPGRPAGSCHRVPARSP